MLEEEEYQWYEIGKENPFNKKILDIRSFTQGVISATPEEKIAEKYSELRASVGEEFIGTSVPRSKTVLSNLRYPHNGDVLRGAAFKADSMECKWDIYVYDDYFYFCRSWTGDLVYKALSKISANAIELIQIEYPSEIEEIIAVNNVHFLIMSHAFGRVFPHMIPKSITDENEIAFYSFSTFGNKACYATYEEIIDTEVKLE